VLIDHFMIPHLVSPVGKKKKWKNGDANFGFATRLFLSREGSLRDQSDMRSVS